MNMKRNGFTLIELLVAFGFVALATVSVLSLMRQSLRLVKTSEDLTLAAQAVLAPNLSVKDLGARVRELRSEPVELGPLQFQTAVLEIIPPDRTEGLQVRIYK